MNLRISNKLILFFIAVVVFLKLLLFISVQLNLIPIQLGKGNDADYYHDYAIGYLDVAVNIWPVILSWLHNHDLYSRDGLPYFLLGLNLFFIPFLMLKLSSLRFVFEQKLYLILILLMLVYPTLYFYTFDIYRDVFMVFSFLVGCFFIKKWIKIKNIILFLLMFSILIVFGLFLVSLRPYLGYAFLVALFLWNVRLTKKRVSLFVFAYLIVLFTLNYLGVLSILTEYRSGFSESGGGSTLGLDFSNPVLFLPNFILSALGQLFGLYITNPLAVILFVVETIPFTYMLYYVFKNISYADKFVQFLLVFFVVYASVWLIGNDNLGTAVRLRMYNYLVIYICFFYMMAKVKKAN